MEHSTRYKEIIELGKQLLKELELDTSNDTLGRWMTHHLAELIHSAENETGEKQEVKKQQCADLILKLWNHKNSLPVKAKPLQFFDSVIESMAILRADAPYYFHFQQEQELQIDNENIKLYLELAKRVDETARTLVRVCVEDAIKHATADEQKWLKTTYSALPKNNKELTALRVLWDTPEDKTEENSMARLQEELINFGKTCQEIGNNIDS